MAKWVNATVLDGGLNIIKTGTVQRLLDTYATGDNLSTVSGNTLASRSLTTGSYTISTTGTARKIVVATGSATATSSSSTGANLHIAVTTTGAVLWVTDETSDQAITASNTVNFPATTYKSLQPT